MAIYSCRVKTFSRARGESATGAVAYRLGLRVENEMTGEIHDFTRRADVAAIFSLAPPLSPAWASVPGRLWNEAEKSETRKNSCVARECLVALPVEMTDSQREELARAIAAQLVSRYQVCASVGIHRPDEDGLNYHAHILMSTRRLGAEGFGEKTRALDDMKEGPRQIEEIRHMVAEQINIGLERHGYECRVDHRSLDDQKLDALESGDIERAAELSRVPTVHQGRRAGTSERIGAHNAALRGVNQKAQERAATEFRALLEAAHIEGRAMPPAMDRAASRKAKQRDDIEAAAAQLVAAELTSKKSALDLDRTSSMRRLRQDRADKEWERLLHLKSQQEKLAASIARSVERVDDWRRRHSIRAWLGWVPASIAKDQLAIGARRVALKKIQRQTQKAAEAESRASRHRARTHAVEVARKARAVEASNELKARLADWHACELREDQGGLTTHHERQQATPELGLGAVQETRTQSASCGLTHETAPLPHWLGSPKRGFSPG